MQTIYVTVKTKKRILNMLIEEKICDPDDPLFALIEAFINRPEATEIRIGNKVRLLFK